MLFLPCGAFGGELHQLRDGGDVPVGALGADVPEVSLQGRHLGVDVLAGPVPVQQGSDCQAVPQVMDAGPAGDARRAAQASRKAFRTGWWQSLVPRMDTKNVVAAGCLRARSSS